MRSLFYRLICNVCAVATRSVRCVAFGAVLRAALHSVLAAVSTVVITAITAVVFCSFAGFSSLAQIRKDSVIVLPGVVVEDSLSSGTNSVDGIASRVITARRMSMWPGLSISDLLSAESFASIRQFGVTGLATVSLRGSGGAHTLITLDGVALTDPQTGTLDLSTVPITFLDSATISEGAAERSGGQSALGGSIQLRSIYPSSALSGKAILKTGAYGERHGGAVVSRSLGGVKMLAAVDLSEYQGDFQFADPSSFPARKVRRIGAARNSTNVFGRAILDGTAGDWDASFWWSRTNRGVPGPSNAPPVVADQGDRSTRLSVSNTQSIRSGSIVSRVTLSHVALKYVSAGAIGAAGDTGAVDMSSSSGTDPVGATGKGTSERSATKSIDLQSTFKRAFPRGWFVHVEPTFRHDQSTIRGGRHQSAGSLDLLASRDGEWATATIAIASSAWQDGARTQTRLLPRAAARILPTGSEGFSIRASAGRIFRPPSFNDRFWLPGGNPDLVPETGWTADSGVDLSASRRNRSIHFSATVFWSALDDKIVWHPSLAGSQIQVWTPDNVGHVIGFGGESSLDLSWQKGDRTHMGATLLYSYTRSEDRTDPLTRSFGRQLRYVPEQTLKARISFSIRDLLLEGNMQWVSKRYTSADERFALPGYHVLSLRARHSWVITGGRLAVMAMLENAGNQPVEPIRFYPTPPRHATLSLQYTFHETDPKPR